MAGEGVPPVPGGGAEPTGRGARCTARGDTATADGAGVIGPGGLKAARGPTGCIAAPVQPRPGFRACPRVLGPARTKYRTFR